MASNLRAMASRLIATTTTPGGPRLELLLARGRGTMCLLQASLAVLLRHLER